MTIAPSPWVWRARILGRVFSGRPTGPAGRDVAVATATEGLSENPTGRPRRRYATSRSSSTVVCGSA
jgi:hypothetical protein